MSVLIASGRGSDSGGSGSDALIFDRLEITKAAFSTNFLRNDPLSVDGIEVTAYYKGNETEYNRVVTNECVFNPADGTILNSLDITKVDISLTDLDDTKTISYTIKVLAWAEYHTTISLGNGTSNAGASVGEHALFAGGNKLNGKVKAYDYSLVSSDAPSLSTARYDMTGTTIGDYAIFAGGRTATGSRGLSNVVDAYSSSLVNTTPAVLGTARTEIAGASVGDYAILYTGLEGATNGGRAVDAYNSSLVKASINTASYDTRAASATSVGEYALFAGGAARVDNSSSYAYVYAYNKSLVRTSVSSLGYSRRYIAGTSVGDYAIFAGGCTYVQSGIYEHHAQDWVDAYNSSLVRTYPEKLEKARYFAKGESSDRFAVIAGGHYNDAFDGTEYTSGSAVNNVDAYDVNLVKQTTDKLPSSAEGMSSARIGDYVLFSNGAKIFAYVA